MGERVYPSAVRKFRLPEQGYGCDVVGRWWMRPPGCNSKRISTVDVVEHADGTVTVSGYLINGQWSIP